MYKKFWEDRIGQVKQVGKELIGKCFSCGKAEHFYANVETGQYHCKCCDESGNAITFLSYHKRMDKAEIAECLHLYGIPDRNGFISKVQTNTQYATFDESVVRQYVSNLSEQRLNEFALERGLDERILRKYELGINEQGEFTLPVRDKVGKIRGICRKEPKGSTKSSRGGEAYLFGESVLEGNDRVFITEGPWSMMAFEQKGYSAVGVPGAGIFKEEWVSSCDGKEVYIVFDLDDAGKQGAEKLAKKLLSVVKSVAVIHLPESLGTGKDIRDFFNSGGTKEQFDDLIVKAKPEQIDSTSPLLLEDFMKLNIPSFNWYIENLLPMNGRGMVSAPTNIGKSIFVESLAMALAGKEQTFLNKFNVTPARVLLLDFEMGVSALKDRIKKQHPTNNFANLPLYLKSLPSFNLLNEVNQQQLEQWIKDNGIQVLILDPLGSAWSGDENNQERVSQLTGYLNILIERYGISVLLVHHWRKDRKGYSSGGQMAAGSYRWEAWVDCHTTLEGQPTAITFTCQKNRHGPRFSPFVAQLNPQTLRFEFLRDYAKKMDDSALIKLFDSFGTTKVTIPQLIAEAHKRKLCSEATLRNLIKSTQHFSLDTSGKTHFLTKKGDSAIS